MVIFSTLMSQCPCSFQWKNCRFQVDLSNCFVPGESGVGGGLIWCICVPWFALTTMVVTWRSLGLPALEFQVYLNGYHGDTRPWITICQFGDHKSAIWVAGVFFPKSVEMIIKYKHKRNHDKPPLWTNRRFANFFRMMYFNIHVLCEPLGVFQLHVLRWTSIEASCGLVQSNPQGRDHLDPKQLYHSERVRVTKRYQTWKSVFNYLCVSNTPFQGFCGVQGCRGFVGMYISIWMLIWPKIWWRWWRGFKTDNWWWLMVQGCWCESRLLKSSAIERLSRWCHLLLL